MKYRCLADALFTFTTTIINDQDLLASEDDLLCDPVAKVEIMIIAIIIIRRDIFVAKVIIIVIFVVITITKDSLASEDDLLCDPVAIMEEAVV